MPTKGQQQLAVLSIGRFRGFSLIELVVSLSVFSLLLIISYSMITSTAQQDYLLGQTVDRQTKLRSAYRVLSTAFVGGAKLIGSRDKIEIQLNAADAPAYMQYDELHFWWDNDGKLLARGDKKALTSELLNEVQSGAFVFVDKGVEHTSWNAETPPKVIRVEFKTTDKPQLTQWLFSSVSQ